MKASAWFIGLWTLGTILFILRSPHGAYTHDLQAHLQHTRILATEHRLAHPHECAECFEPPLYYSLNQLIAPRSPSHIFYVRLLSVAYGTIVLCLMAYWLKRFDAKSEATIAVLAFISTTPAFLFMFTTYNNDSLATPLHVGMLSTLGLWLMDEKPRDLFLFGLLTTAALHTKLSTVFILGPITLLLIAMGLRGIVTWKKIKPVGIALAISSVLLLPWLLGHNYRLTGELTPAPADRPVVDGIGLPAPAWKVILTPPLWTPGEWKDPYAHVWEATHNKKHSYWAYIFDTSVFGEFTFEFLPKAVPWMILFFHAGLWVAVFAQIRTSRWASWLLGLIFLGALFMSSLIFRSSYYAALMDFRYITWTRLPLALVFSLVLLSPDKKIWPAGVFKGVFIGGTLLHGLLWLGLVLGGRWNLP